MSREAELYKDKIEVSLDGRQIFYLFFGGSVVVGLVFVLGVMVGRRVEARGHVDRARVAATVDPLAALDRLEGNTAMSFQGSLRGNEGPASDVEKQIAALDKPADPKAEKAKAKAEAPKADVKPEAKKDEPKAEAKKDEAKADVKSEPKAEAKKDEAKKDEAKKDDAKKSETKTETKTDAKKTEAKTDEAKAETKTKKDEPKAAAKTEEPKKEEKKQRYTLQLSSFQEKSEAEALVASVKAAGHDAHITEGVVDGKQYFRVRTGTYKSMEAASEAKGELEKISNKSAIVTRL
jgi:DedD protein